MENFDKLQQLVAKTGVSYEDAKAALENNNWDMIDAIIWLEQQGKTAPQSASFRSGEQAAQDGAADDAKKVDAEVVNDREAANKRPEGFGQQARGYNTRDARQGAQSTVNGQPYKSYTGYEGPNADREANRSKFKEDVRRFWNKFRGVMVNNRMLVIGKAGNVIIDLPIFVPVLALIVFFWGTIGVAVVAMLFGCRFHFEGQDLGRTNINSTMDLAGDTAQRVWHDFTGGPSAEQKAEFRDAPYSNGSEGPQDGGNTEN